MDKEYLTYHYTELGKTTREIAKENGCSHLSILKSLHDFGISVKGKGPRKNRVIVKCENCFKPIERRPSTLSKKNFCSYDCYHAWMPANTRGENSTNWKGGITAISSDNLKTPEFREAKKIVLGLFPVCVICGNDKFKHVHHIKTRRQSPELVFEKSNLITLCRSCHSRIKGKEQEWEAYFMRLVCKGGELRETLNAQKAHGNPQPSQSNVRSLVDWKVQRLTVEDSQSNKTDTSAAPERDEIVRAYAKA